MLDFGLSDAHEDAGGQREIAPFILAEDPEGLGGGFEDALGADLRRCARCPADRGRRPGRSGRPWPENIIFVFYSP